MIWTGDTLVSPGEAARGERTRNGCRVWDPAKSKLAALYYLGNGPDLTGTMRVLYLGASYGTTVSHVADYVEVVYAIDNAPRPMQDLLRLCSRQENIIPILADAAHPERYMALVESVDLIYQDVAQRDQAGIAIKNLHFLKPGCTCVLMLKTRSIDVTRPPKELCAETVQRLNPFFRSIAMTWLSPCHKDHAAVVCEGLI